MNKPVRLTPKPCPNCSGIDLLMHGLHIWADKIFVECTGCKLQGPHTNTEEQALTAWNYLSQLTTLHGILVEQLESITNCSDALIVDET